MKTAKTTTKTTNHVNINISNNKNSSIAFTPFIFYPVDVVLFEAKDLQIMKSVERNNNITNSYRTTATTVTW